MKKILLFISLFLLVGCSKNSTPTRATETFLKKYQTLDESVLSDLELSSESGSLSTNEQKELYMKAIKMQYSDMKFKITDEHITADDAVVTVNITVYDFYKSKMETDMYLNNHRDTFLDENQKLDNDKFIMYKLKNMLETSDRIEYTILIYLKKEDKDWKVLPLDKVTLEKLHGTYNYDRQ